MAHPSPAPVSVLGLGAMGTAIAGTLLDAGHPVTVWNRTTAKTDSLVARGATRAATPPEAVRASNLVLVCVTDDAAARAAIAGASDDLHGRALVTLHTGTPAQARDLEAWAAGRGVGLLSGTLLTVPNQLGTPEALIFYAGSRATWDAHQGTLATLGGKTTYLGEDPSLAALYDASLLVLLYATMTGWLQAFALVGSAGVRAAEFLPHAQAWFESVVTADDPAEVANHVDRREYPDLIPSPLALNAAALGLLVDVHRDVGVDASIVDAIHRLAARRVAGGHGADGYTSLIEAMRAPAD